MLKKKRKGGFTLIELIVVIAIIAILAVIAIPRLGAFRATAQTAQYDADERIIEGAASMYNANFGVWPTAVSQLSAYLEPDVITKYGTKTIDANGQVVIP
ncbi:MAG: prepilin-type N-terminal cleavage/methylation domain-containing protein [Clostridiales bacterium]|nr:prepilin-type N-terminal cleavage/methylation domain-containing protein [Clostridiales bacterium]